MTQSLNIKISGLYTFPSDLSSVPEGALAEADNIIVDKDNIAEPRRGFDVLTHGASVKSTFSDASYRANKIFFYQNQVLASYSTNLFAYNNTSSGWANYSGTYAPPSATVPMRSAQANKNFYFTTSLGVFKLDAYTGTPTAAGVPSGLDVTAVTSSGPPSVWLALANSVAYRIVWGIKDANSNLILGSPSQRVEITNTTAASIAVDVNFTIPSGITTAHFFQIYRSVSTPFAAEPNDELGLVYEGNPSSSDISNGSLLTAITDVVPDALRGATIYTAQSQEGLANANNIPPFALDLADFRNCLFYGNTMGLQNYTLTLLGTGSPSGVQANDTLVIDGVTFTGKTSETIASGFFKVTTAFLLATNASTNSSTSLTSVATTTGIAAGQIITGTGIPPGTYVVSIVSTTVTMSQAATASASGVDVTFTGDSAGQAIRDTSLSLVRVINRYASSTVTAYYLSGPTDLPGMILLQAKTPGTSAFVLTSSRATCWNPALPSSGTTQSSTNDAFKNAIFYSKVSEPEAVPLGNFIFVGSADKNILRVIALRDSLFILKEDGIFRLYGTDPTNFQISPLDYTAILIAPESAVSLNNQIYALTTQGVVAISETGVSIMSHPIEDELTALTSENYTTLQTTSFGVAYESSRAYYLFCISNGADTFPTQYFRYNYITNTWTHATLSKYCGAVNPVDDKLYFGNTGLNIVDIERKSYTYTDYADYASTQTISNVSGVTVTISSTDTILVGSIIYQSATVFATVAAVNPIAGTVTTTLASSLVNGSADVLSPIACTITWIPVTLANPGFSKQLHEVSLLFLSDFNGSATVGFISDISATELFETIQGGNVGGWGEFGWGGPADTVLGVPWGGANRRRPIRVMVPRNHQRCSLLTVSFNHAYGYSPWLLQGISLIGNAVSERVAN